MSGFASAAKWHEGLTSEELDRATAISGIHQLSKKDRRVVLAFVLCLAAITVIAAATLVRVAPHERKSVPSLPISPSSNLSPPAVNLSAERHHEQ